METMLSMGMAVLGGALGWAKSMGSEVVALKLSVPGDLAFITDELESAQYFLVAIMDHRDGNKVDTIRKIRDLSHEVEDFLDDFVVRMEKKSRWYIIPGTMLLHHRHVAKRLKALRIKFEDVRQMRLGYPHLVTTSGSNSKRTASTDAAALSYVAYDEYVLHGDCEVVHADDGIPLEQYKKIKPMVLEYNMFTVENGFHVLPGETNELMVYQIASEESKKITRTILKSLWRNELSSVCFTHFSESNIVVSSSGRAKFRNIIVIRNLTGHDLLQHQMSNYLSAHTIIEDLFSGNPPEDIQHLLSLIKQEFGPRGFFHIHGSLLPVAMHSLLFKSMYDHIRLVFPAEDLRAILGSLPYVGTWKSQIGTNELLKIPFNRNPKSYVVPSDKRGQTCLNKFQKEALKDLGLTQQPHQKSLSKDEIKLIEALQFINYLRNKASHRMEPYQKLTEANKAYKAHGSELVTYVRFPLIIPYMQLQLFNRKMHNEISMDKFF